MAPHKFQELLEVSQHRPLTTEEKSSLEALFLEYPELRTEWQSEMALSALLNRAFVSEPSTDLLDSVMLELERNQPQPGHSVASRLFDRFSRISFRPSVLIPFSMAAVVICSLTLLDRSSFYPETSSIKALSSPEFAEGASAILAPDTIHDFEAILYSVEVDKMVDKELLTALESLR